MHPKMPCLDVVLYNLTCIYRSSLLKSVHAGNRHLNSRCINNYPCVGATGLCDIINKVYSRKVINTEFLICPYVYISNLKMKEK